MDKPGEVKEFEQALVSFKYATSALVQAWDNVSGAILGDTCDGIDCSFDEFALKVGRWEIQLPELGEWDSSAAPRVLVHNGHPTVEVENAWAVAHERGLTYETYGQQWTVFETMADLEATL